MMFFSCLKFKRVNLGFTLIEMLLVVAIFGIISTAAYALISDYNKTSDYIAAQLTLQSDGRNSLNQMVNDLRRANQGSNGAFAIDSANAVSLVFYSNIDTDSYFEKVEYFIDGTELRKSVTKPSGSPLVYNPADKTTVVLSVKIANGAAPIFSYYNDDYVGTGAALTLPVDVTAIRFVKINLILDDNPSAPTSSLKMEAKAALRNLKDN